MDGGKDILMGGSGLAGGPPDGAFLAIHEVTIAKRCVMAIDR
jgi:hypothetical protein